MENKITAKDVAKEAGVSVATVSYVLNGRTDQKISPETQKKIIQIANLMNYVPSHAAKSLATGRNNAIGISYSLSSFESRNSEIMKFVNLLIERFNRMKYDVTFIPSKAFKEGLPVNRNIDAIVAIDLTQDDFRVLSDSYLVPVICVDMIVNDSLFYQIYEDVPFLIEKALIELPAGKKTYFIYDSVENAYFEQFILNLPGDIFPIRQRELSPALFEKIKEENIIVLGNYLTLSVLMNVKKDNVCAIISDDFEKQLPVGTKYVFSNIQKKANITMNIVMNTINRNFDLEHDHKIR